MDFKRNQDPQKWLGLGYKGKMNTSSWKILEFIRSKGKEGASLTEIQKFIFVDLNGNSEEDFWKPSREPNERSRWNDPSEKLRATRGYWTTALYGGRTYKGNHYPGLLNKYCKKNPITKKWVLEKMPLPGETIYEERSNKFVSETLNEFLNNRYIK